MKSLAETMIRMNDDYCYKFGHLGLPWYIACCQGFIQGLSYWSSPMMRSHRLSQEWSFTSLSTISLLFSSCNPEKDDSWVVCCIKTIMASRRTDSWTSRYCHVCVLCVVQLPRSLSIGWRGIPAATPFCYCHETRCVCASWQTKGELHRPPHEGWTCHRMNRPPHEIHIFCPGQNLNIRVSDQPQCNLCKALDQYGTLADYSRRETTFQNWFKCLKKKNYWQARESRAENN